MPGVFLWAWDDSISEWIKVAVNPSGELEVAGMEFPDDYPLPAAQVTDLKKITEIPDPVISQATPENLKHVPHGYYETGDVYKPLAVDVNGKLLMLSTPTAHKDTHDPEDGADPLDTAIAVKVGDANAIGTSHSLARADHVHEKHHAKYLDADAVTAMGAKADDNPLHHDRAEEWGATEHTAIGDAAPHHAKYTDAEAVDAIEADDNLPLASITFIIDGGGSAITIGEKGHLRIPFACTISRVTMLADVAGAIVVDIWKSLYVGFPPDNGDSITAAAPPTIVATNQKSEDSTLTGWTTAIVAGAILAFNVDSCTTITRVTISLKVTKS